MKIDKRIACQILEEEALSAKGESPHEIWDAMFEEIYVSLHESGQTIVAALGTALLAKATDLRVDVFSLKVGDDESSNKYSARALCKEVLAAHAPRLGIDLGVHGREPLNNQPFFGKSNLYEARDSSHDKTRSSMDLLIQCLDRVALISDANEARSALRAFIRTRLVQIKPLPSLGFNLESLSRDGLLSHIKRFVEGQSEFGKRAQSVVAGLLDAQGSEVRVRVAKVHDPDRNFPGDVVLLGNTGEPWIAFEVRDKPVSASDLDHFAAKCSKHHIVRATVVACVRSPNPDELDDARRRAESNGVLLSLYGSWRALLDDVLMWSYHPQDVILSRAVTRILARAAELEVSAAGLQLWASEQ